MTTPPPASDDGPSAPVLALGEIALRVTDLDASTGFYADVVGLSVLRRFDAATFLTLGESAGGHTAVVALFDRSDEPGYEGLDPARTTVDHVAFTVAAEEFDAERERLESLGVKLDFAYHDWVAWRSLYFDDPDGNRLEFVCYDPE
jgi:catechol 2,3-dioxygenase-like lactoylglutathione lyase family enzyme